MVFRTFNSWEVVAPVTMVFALAVAFLSISESGTGAEKRISDRHWKYGAILYCVAVWVGLSELFIAESLLGMIECLGGYASDAADAASRARSTFWIITAIWATIIYVATLYVRNRRISHINDAVMYGRSKADRRRRKREERKRRADAKKLKALRKLSQKSNIVYFVNIKDGSSSVKTTHIPKASKTAQKTSVWKLPLVKTSNAQKAKQEEHVSEPQPEDALKDYRIEKRTDLEVTYTDENGQKHSITEYLEDGACEYFVAISLKDDDEVPLFLGSGTPENAEENLRRYLTMELEKSDCSKHAAV